MTINYLIKSITLIGFLGFLISPMYMFVFKRINVTQDLVLRAIIVSIGHMIVFNVYDAIINFVEPYLGYWLGVLIVSLATASTMSYLLTRVLLVEYGRMFKYTFNICIVYLAGILVWATYIYQNA